MLRLLRALFGCCRHDTMLRVRVGGVLSYRCADCAYVVPILKRD